MSPMMALALTDLPEPDSAQNDQRLAGIDVEADAVRRAEGAAERQEVDGQVLDLKQMRAGHVAFLLKSLLRAGELDAPALLRIGIGSPPARKDIERKRGQQDRKAGPERDPPSGREIAAAGCDHGTPGELRCLDAEAKEAQRGFRQNHRREVDGADGDERRYDDRRDMPEENAAWPAPSAMAALTNMRSRTSSTSARVVLR